MQSTLLLLPLALVLIFWLNTKRQLCYPQRFLSMSEAVIADEKFDELESGQDIRAVFLPPFMMDDKGQHLFCLLVLTTLTMSATCVPPFLPDSCCSR